MHRANRLRIDRRNSDGSGNPGSCKRQLRFIGTLGAYMEHILQGQGNPRRVRASVGKVAEHQLDRRRARASLNDIACSGM
jgi:hypothetical protein